MKKELFEKYSEIEKEITSLEKKKEEVKAEIKSEMEKEGVDTVKANYGTFFFTIRRTWKYSDAVKKIADKLSEQKKEEEQDGTAKATETKSLSFRAAKVGEVEVNEPYGS